MKKVKQLPGRELEEALRSVHCGDVAGVLVWGSLLLKRGADAEGWSGVHWHLSGSHSSKLFALLTWVGTNKEYRCDP